MNNPPKPREATIQFSETYGELPLLPKEAGFAGSLLRHWLPFSLQNARFEDFESRLTNQVNNTGRWVDAEFSIDGWTALGDYGVVLLDRLRQNQIDEYEAGKDVRGFANHPDFKALARSVGEMAVVGVVNPPSGMAESRHVRERDDMYLGIAASGVEIFARLRYFTGLYARGRLERLYQVPGGLSAVTKARNLAASLQETQVKKIPELRHNGRLAYVDVSGNVRLEMRDGRAIDKLFAGHKRAGLYMYALGFYDKKYGHIGHVSVVSDPAEIPEGEMGVYRKPAESGVGNKPQYVELVRRAGDTNSSAGHAYGALCDTFLWHAEDDIPRSYFTPSMWDDMDIYLVPEE